MAGSCLIIMPFSDDRPSKLSYPENHWKDVYSKLLCPAVRKAGLSCHRDDDDFVSRPIALNIWKKIDDADIVLCDVSSCRANVFLELGWAFRADKPYVIAVDERTQPPFDVQDFNRFEYDHALSPLTLQERVDRLSRMLSATLNDPLD